MDVDLESLLHAFARQNKVITEALRKAGLFDEPSAIAMEANTGVIERTLAKIGGVRRESDPG